APLAGTQASVATPLSVGTAKIVAVRSLPIGTFGYLYACTPSPRSTGAPRLFPAGLISSPGSSVELAALSSALPNSTVPPPPPGPVGAVGLGGRGTAGASLAAAQPVGTFSDMPAPSAATAGAGFDGGGVLEVLSPPPPPPATRPITAATTTPPAIAAGKTQP